MPATKATLKTLAAIDTDQLLEELVRRIPQPTFMPPFFSPTPAENAASMDLLVRIYMLDSGSDLDTVVVDMIVNLLHWADHQPDDTQNTAREILRLALVHHDEEVIEEAERLAKLATERDL